MAIGNLFVVVFLSYFTLHLLTMFFFKNKRTALQQTNEQLNKLRSVPVKTLEQQKEFINLRYPKRGKFKWSWNMLPPIILRIGVFIGIIYIYRYLLNLTGINFKLWQAILFIIIFPLILNLILERFNIQKGDLRVFLR